MKWHRITVSAGLAIALSGCVPWPTPSQDQKLDTIALTNNDVYVWAMPSPGHVGAVYGGTNGNVRDVSWPSNETASTDQESCAETTSQSAVTNQEGVALRVHSTDTGWHAITVTKNIWAGATYIFNVHLWDTVTGTVPSPIAQFNLLTTFPNGATTNWLMCARVTGNTLDFKAWNAGQKQPSYGTYTVQLPSGWSDPGEAGWYAGHLGQDEGINYANAAA